MDRVTARERHVGEAHADALRHAPQATRALAQDLIQRLKQPASNPNADPHPNLDLTGFTDVFFHECHAQSKSSTWRSHRIVLSHQHQPREGDTFSEDAPSRIAGPAQPRAQSLRRHRRRFRVTYLTT